MESLNKDTISSSFVQQMLHNKFLLLAVALGVVAAVYFVAGLYMMLSH